MIYCAQGTHEYQHKLVYLHSPDRFGVFIMNGVPEFYMAYHFPSKQYIRLQDCKHCFAIILWGRCPHNWPDSGLVNENVSFLR